MTTALIITTLNEIIGVKKIVPKIKKEWLDEIIFVVNASKGTEYLNALGTPVSKLSKSEVFEIVSSSSTLEPIDLEEISESSKATSN